MTMLGCTPYAYDEESVVMRSPEELDEYFAHREEIGGSNEQ